MTDKEIQKFQNNWLKLAKLKIAISAHTIQGWEGQYKRMFRFYKRTIDAIDNIDRLDYAFTFFQNCYHLSEWIRKIEQINKADWNKRWGKFTSGYPIMKICRDICNGTKHLTLNSPSIDKNFAFLLEYEPWHTIDGTRSDEWKIFVNNQKYTLPDLMISCIKAWDYFIRTELIVQ